MFRYLYLGSVLALMACASPPDSNGLTSLQLSRLLPADVVLLGEQHDAPDHQRVQKQAVLALAGRDALAALLLEMAEQGRSTLGLPGNATQEQVQTALAWNASGWPWPAYGPAIMAAVQAGVPVLGANLPRSAMRDSMRQPALDGLLPGPALKAQQQLIRIGHCNLLPESQIRPMTRIQIARDVAMANTIVSALKPGKTVLLLAGHGHVNRQLGIPQHLPATLQLKAVRIGASAEASTASGLVNPPFDLIWPAQDAPEKDYCAEFSKQLKPAA